MRRYVQCVTVSMLLAGIGTVSAEQPKLFPQIGIDASLPLQWSNNVLTAPSDYQGDGSTSPYLKLSVGQLSPTEDTLGYSVYTTATGDVYNRIRDAESALATIGANLTAVRGHYVFGGYFEHTYLYDGFYRQRVFTADDVSLFVQRKFVFKDIGLLIKPSFAPAYRFADLDLARRAAYTFKIDVKKQIAEKYYFVATPKVKFLQYTDGANSDRRDWISSISAGVEYDVSDDLSINANAGYEKRSSNFAGRDYDAFTVGLSIDFSRTFDR